MPTSSICFAIYKQTEDNSSGLTCGKGDSESGLFSCDRAYVF